MSIHIEAKKEEISKLVLMCGDPLRAKYIAETYLKNFRCINNVRNMLGYTGEYDGKSISVMSHGMGNPSMGIYSYELFNDYDVDVIIRIGTAGSYTNHYDINDIILVKESFSDSIYSYAQNNSLNKIILSNEELNKRIINESNNKGIKIDEERVYSTDVFYTKEDITEKMKNKFNCKAVEMESFALFHNANIFNKKAACILTISDSFLNDKKLSSEEKEKGLKVMIELALDTLKNIGE